MAYQNRNWEDLGDAIEEIIDYAVSSRDFQKLNQTITQAINKAVGTGAQSVRKAVDAAQKYKAPPAKQAYYTPPASAPVKKAEQSPLPALYRNTSGKMALGIVKTVFGSIMTLSASMELLIAGVLRSILLSTPFLSVSTAAAILVLGGGAALLGSGTTTIGKLNRFQKYVTTLGQKTYCDVQQLSANVGKSKRFVKKELQRMIDEGLFLEGHLDEEQTSLITSNDTYHHYRQALEQHKMRQAQQKASEIDPQLRDVLEKGSSFIRQIHACNDAIPGKEISDKISHMEMIVQKIFDRSRTHPEIVPDLKKLMDYYLPITVKLLNAYAEMDAQPIQGETILASKREIEDSLDTLNNAFEKLLDSVFRETAMDISSDISVLQTLLSQEGLTDDELTRMKNRENAGGNG